MSKSFNNLKKYIYSIKIYKNQKNIKNRLKYKSSDELKPKYEI